MKIILFYHSLVSDWNHGNAHFLRGIATDLLHRGHQVEVYEPANGWSLQNLRQWEGDEAIRDFYLAFPQLQPHFYQPQQPGLEQVLQGADLVIVHEWNDPELVRQIGEQKKQQGFTLFFHDTHHRLISEPENMARYQLEAYDGVLAYGKIIRDIYLQKGWAKNAWTWHEAADTRVFYPVNHTTKQGDLVWIGNWGDEERSSELTEFLIEPVKALGIKAKVYGVRYPDTALRALREAGIEYGGWLPNYRVPAVFAQYRLTVHIPRRYYSHSLPGIPTIRPFEALACAIPLISAPWQDAEGLFAPGKDFLFAKNGQEMKEKIAALLADPQKAAAQAQHGLHSLLQRHTCKHRVDELMDICRETLNP